MDINNSPAKHLRDELLFTEEETLTWRYADELRQAPNGEMPYVEIIKIENTTRNVAYFLAIFDYVYSENHTGNILQGIYRGELYEYLDDYIAIYGDDNNNSQLDSQDRLIDRIDLGFDFGGIPDGASGGIYQSSNGTLDFYLGSRFTGTSIDVNSFYFYSLTPSANTINEGGTLTTSVATTYVASGTTLYYALSGIGISAADFSAGALTGQLSVDTNGTASFSHTLASDLTTEGTETIQIKLFSDSARTIQVGETASVTITDTSTTPQATWSITPKSKTVNEGSIATFIVQTDALTIGARFYWEAGNFWSGVTQSDFTSYSTFGSAAIGLNGTTSIDIEIRNDQTTDGDEELIVKLYLDPERKQRIEAQSITTIKDTSQATKHGSVIGPSQSQYAALQGEAGANGEKYIGIESGKESYLTRDIFLLPDISPSFRLQAYWGFDLGMPEPNDIILVDSKVDISRVAQFANCIWFEPGWQDTPLLDTRHVDKYKGYLFGRDPLAFEMAYYDGGMYWENQAPISGQFGGIDFSGINLDEINTLTPDQFIQKYRSLISPYLDDGILADALDTKPTHKVSISTDSIHEGGTLTTSIATTNVVSGTTLYYALSGTGITAADFSSGALTGQLSVDTNGSASFSHTLNSDLTTEGPETLQIKLFSDSARTIQVGETTSVTIADTSTTPAPTYSLTPSSASINEGGTLTTSIATTNVVSGTTLYYALSGTGISAADFSSGALTGQLSVDTNRSASFSHTLASDLTTEGSETLQIKLFSDSARTIQVGSTASVTISDTSEAYVYSLQTSASIINEGSVILVTISTDPGNAGTLVNWRVSGDGIDSYDFSGDALSGKSTINLNGSATVKLKIANDQKAEGFSGIEKAVIEVAAEGRDGIQLAEAAFNIKDTTYKLEEILTNAWTIETNNLAHSWASGNGGKTPFIVSQDSILLGGSNSSYLPTIRRIDSSNGATSEIQLKINEYLGKNSAGDISYIAETGTPNELIVGGYASAPLASGGGSDNAFIARMRSNGDVIWLNGYAITNQLETLIDAETRTEGVYALFRSTRASDSKSIVSKYDPKTGITTWTNEIIGIPKDIAAYGDDVYALYWENGKGSKIYKINADSGQILTTQNLSGFAGRISIGVDGLLIIGSDAIYIANRELTQISERTWKEALPRSEEFLDINTYTLSTGEALAAYATTKDRLILASLIKQSVSYNIFDFDEDIVGITGFSTSQKNPIALTAGKVISFEVISKEVNTHPTGTPTLSGTFKAGRVITIDKTPIQDADNFTGYTPDFKYSWEVSSNGTTWTALTTADATDNNTSYTLTTAEVGKQVRGVVSYLDGYGTQESVNSAVSAAITSSAPAVQSLTLSAPGRTTLRSGTSTTSSIAYNVSTGESALTGIGASLYFDSSQLAVTTAGDPFQKGLIGNAITADTNNVDGDPKTDKVLALTYADFGGQFPGAGTSLPLTIANLNLVPTASYAGTTLHLKGSPATGFTATGADLTLAYNAAPTVNGSISALSTNRGKAFSYTVPSTLFSDADSTLTLSASSSTGAALPSWLSFNAETRTLSGTPTTGGTLNLNINAADELGSVSAPLTLKVREVQQLSSSSTPLPYQRNKDLTVPINYSTSDGSSSTGLAFKVHFNSSLFSFDSSTGVSSKAQADLFQVGAVQLDTTDSDNDPTTDRFIPISIASFSGQFPSGTAPTKLADLTFRSADKAIDPLTGLRDTSINFSETSVASGYGFSSTSASLKPLSFNLDVDGDGLVTPLGDGLMVIRYLFGAAFAGDALINKAISPDSPLLGGKSYSTMTPTEKAGVAAQVAANIQQGIDSKLLDVDKDGQITPLGDGLMVIRRLFGAAFDGAALTSKAISPDSPYFGPPADFTAVAANIDALKPTTTATPVI